jgi:hypothetical protein
VTMASSVQKSKSIDLTVCTLTVASLFSIPGCPFPAACH